MLETSQKICNEVLYHFPHGDIFAELVSAICAGIIHFVYMGCIACCRQVFLTLRVCGGVLQLVKKKLQKSTCYDAVVSRQHDAHLPRTPLPLIWRSAIFARANKSRREAGFKLCAELRHPHSASRFRQILDKLISIAEVSHTLLRWQASELAV